VENPTVLKTTHEPFQLTDSTEARWIFDPDEDVGTDPDEEALTPGMSEADKPGVGMPCIGNRWHSRGNCGKLSIQRIDAVHYNVQLYCYSVALTGKPGAKASTDASGVCKVPRRKLCLADEQCRRGTYCRYCEKSNGYTCQEVTQDYMHRLPGLKVLPTESVSFMLVFVTRNYIKSLEAAASSQEGLTRDPRTGAISPYGVNPQLAISALQDLEKSFANIEEATVAGANSASKSGASFILSGDGRFIMKSIRAEEFTVFADRLVEQIADHAGFEFAECTTEDPPLCWASHALAHTSLVVPLLAFSNPKNNEYWTAMPAVAQMRGFVTSRNVTDLSPWGTVHYFDTKPLPAKSNARSTFLRTLAQSGFHPKDPRTHPAQTAQWNNLNETLRKDVELLSVKTQEGESQIDYSLFFELYQPSRNVHAPGPGCISSVGCFHQDVKGICWVLCISIIDYFVTYGPMRKLESLFKGGKFNGYGSKVIEMLDCSFDQVLPAGAKSKLVERSEQNTLLRWQIPRGHLVDNMKVCAEYTEIACHDLHISHCDHDRQHIIYVAHNFGRRVDFCTSHWARRAFVVAQTREFRDLLLKSGPGTLPKMLMAASSPRSVC